MWITSNIMKFFWNSSFRLIFSLETIEMPADIHCQHCLSGKDIMLKTIQPSSKNTFNIVKLFWILGFGCFSIKKPYRMWADTYCQNCLSGKCIMLKTTQPFSKSSDELCLTFIWKLKFLCQKICKLFFASNMRLSAS